MYSHTYVDSALFYLLPAVIMLTCPLVLFFLKQTTSPTSLWPAVQRLSQKHPEHDCFLLILLLELMKVQNITNKC